MKINASGLYYRIAYAAWASEPVWAKMHPRQFPLLFITDDHATISKLALMLEEIEIGRTHHLQDPEARLLAQYRAERQLKNWLGVLGSPCSLSPMITRQSANSR